MKKPRPVEVIPFLDRPMMGLDAYATEFSLPPLRAADPLTHWVAVGGEAVLLVFGSYNYFAGHSIAALVTILPLVMILSGQIASLLGRRWPFNPGMILFVLALSHLALAWLMTPMVLLWAFPSLVAAFLMTRSQNVNIYAGLMLIGGTGIAAMQTDYALAVRFPLAFSSVWLLLFILLRVVANLRQTAFEQSITDPLTGCYNRRYLDHYMEAKHRQDRGAMLLLDMDRFKDLNDEHGHAAGDQALRRLTMICQATWPGEVSCFRIGGDEFVLMLRQPEKHDLTGMSAHEQDRRLFRFAKTVINTLNADGSFSVSGGLAPFGWPAEFEEIYRRADVALYQAKDEGRGRLCVSESPTSVTQSGFSSEKPPSDHAIPAE
ncbi:GGDEF domain-containing protein [Aliiroseovarius lamellibrachiae]|uniref:GGDEF domain-containing protein n=1 Tax=Aliiroseovarius lamellibrachiae TaxID=1924933 RepID=UPI001BDF9E74|nr:GGDEF domain-containing protein [Aliiroseovarius lamellibrachiae]MBT2132063.1 GGDEF domain-containing protein [Aliiroseovarius lamellibrachiae]